MPQDLYDEFRLMAVHAHPDDESSKGAATMARYAAEGADVLVVTCTGGERGSVLNPALDTPETAENMTDIRRIEMDRARAILGVRQSWLGFVDSGWPDGDPRPPLPEGCFGLAPLEESVPRLVKQMREFRPHVVITYDEKGGYPHPDHVMCHTVSMAAYEASGDPEQYPELGEPWQPLKLYYHMNMSRRRLETIDALLVERGRDRVYDEWIANWGDRPDTFSRITTRVPCADYFEQRDDALRAHATQIDPYGRWFAAPLEIQKEAWPTEDFELASAVFDAPIPEDDLFAGVRDYLDSQSTEVTA